MADNDEKNKDGGAVAEQRPRTAAAKRAAAKKARQPQLARGREKGDEDADKPIDESPVRGGRYQNGDGDDIDSEGRVIDPETGEPINEREAALKIAQQRAADMTAELEEAGGVADEVDEDDDEIELGVGRRAPAGQ